MKISKIFAGMSAAVVSASLMAITAFAGSGTITAVPDGWSGADSGLGKRILIGADSDTPAFTRDDQAKMAEMSTVRVTIDLGADADVEGFGTAGSIVVQGTVTGWGQHDWGYGVCALDKDGNVDAAKNDGLKLYKDGTLLSIEYTDEAGIFNAEDPAAEDNFYGICIQNFGGVKDGEEIETSWSVSGIAIYDASGSTVFEEGTVGGGDEWVATPASNESSNTESSTSGTESGTSSAASSTASSSSSAASTTSKTTTTTNTTKTTSTAAASSTASDNTNTATGATAGIALAGIALAGAAVVVAKRK